MEERWVRWQPFTRISRTFCIELDHHRAVDVGYFPPWPWLIVQAEMPVEPWLRYVNPALKIWDEMIARM